MAGPIQNLINTIQEISNLRDSTVKFLQEFEDANGSAFDLSKEVPGLNKSHADVDSRMVLICELGKKLNPDIDAAIVPDTMIDEVVGPLKKIHSVYESIVSNISGAEKGSVDAAAYTILAGDGQVFLDVGKAITHIWQHSANALANLCPLLNVIQGEGSADLSAVLSSFRGALELLGGVDELTQVLI